MKKHSIFALSLLTAAVLAGCASLPSSAELDKIAASYVKADFKDKGIVKASVLQPEEINTLCTEAEVAGKPIDPELAQKLQATQLKTIKWPADGNYLGDWKKGEALAQSGRGQTWTDKANTPNGGNCYNCHQLSGTEISFGTIGPSLYKFRKNYGIDADPNSVAAKAMVEYAWGKIYNSRAYNACSVMPRAIHNGIITEAQAKDLMALLLDPNSPVNQ
ncbi:sulfur oxidation c-type cytochrome SoxX [Rhodoferax antarcticus]|uniref:Putative cytochrome c n=1 Tax=Rhodoferax antarcticus ANT.BR TaxID=1111071 RepID=A0A1Q8YKD5_9BURK|nr:sulfur oxidation c-type cytochrome SoxX [Rhodoferax antarcticus]APW47395.1 sulfur oxidation c-type cytochrome SoxX [Rhodoferax antarcticus]MCW2311999.1 sulfur-oxidizing protein SoxX [Rhodoferax antarcticus]OLP08508.1 putative cytochrome c [Rhodoferax antarcticus ANT.BR]